MRKEKKYYKTQKHTEKTGKRTKDNQHILHQRNLMRVFFLTLTGTMLLGLIAIFLLKPKEQNITIVDFHTFGNTSQKELLTEEPPALSEEPSEDKEKVTEKTEGTLLFAGDVLLDDSYAIMSTFRTRGSILQNAFNERLLQEMASADIFMLNNEFTFTNRGEATADKKFTFRAKPENVSLYQEIGVDIVSLANNHAYDYGEISVLDTLDTLEQADIKAVGAGRNIGEASETVYMQAGSYKIAFLAATQIERNPTPDTKGATEEQPGVFRCNKPDLLVERLKEAKQNSDFVVLYIHWGTESTTELDELQRSQAQLYTESGADIIIGNHSHCLQRIAYINNVPVIFSLGNFWFNSKTQDTCLIKVYLSEEGMRWQFIPCRQSDCSTEILEGDERERVLEYMRNLSPDVVIDEEGFIRQE